MPEVRHSVKIGLSYSNTTGPLEVIESMYPSWQQGSAPTDGATANLTVGDLSLTTFNSSLWFEAAGEELAILGNTKTGTCPVAKDCGSCALAGSGLSLHEMSGINCARANTAVVFESIEQDPYGAFVLLPTSDKAYVVEKDRFDQEYNGDQLMQNRLKPANSVVFTKSWLEQQGIDRISVAMNGADGSFGVATVNIVDETLIIPFCSMRTNMGDRNEEKQILKQALNAYFDSQDMPGGTRLKLLEQMDVNIVLSASASLANFAHKIRIPESGSQDDSRLRNQYPELVARAGDRVTSAIVLNDQYPGAFDRGSIFPEFEAKMGIHSTPITPDNCPGDGQTCHVDYRAETKYALLKQLEEMGVPKDKVNYDDSFAIDPSDPTNNAASNRAEQNNGVSVAMTNRTLNGMTISLK